MLELIWVLPFLILLFAIAVCPLLAKTWWEHNYAFLALGLGALVICRYLFILHEAHLVTHVVLDYVSFIILIGSLYVVAGGIHIQVKGEAAPAANCLFLLFAAMSANVLGTTGASMVFIRPWLRMNKYRLTAFHVVFFIFIVSNVGGALTPMGDPPLFLGYLQGIPFFWVIQNLWRPWVVVIAFLLVVFFILDSRNFARAPKQIRQIETGAGETWKFTGGHNVFFLLIILGSVFIGSPPFLREAAMLTAAFLSFVLTSKQVHQSNDFSFAPIKEVAVLFAGIFCTMIPALQWLEVHAGSLGIKSPGHFFWGSGVLSSVLDNAPTYLNFLSAAAGLLMEPAALLGDGGKAVFLIENHPVYVQAISAGAVFFGAMTYIGNGPNLLVKAIADQSKAKTPGFFSYIFCYSLPILLPAFVLTWMLFFKQH